MRLRGIDFGPVWGASGVQGWFGEGYRFHHWWGPLGPRFDGMTFVSKTTTLNAREGNMALTGPSKLPGFAGWQPKRLVPKCVKVYPFKGMVVNSVGLSGPGAQALFDAGKWQERKTPFLLSFMSVAPTPEERLNELIAFRDLLLDYVPTMRAKLALQINFSCPNVGLDPSALTAEIQTALDLFADMGVPIVPKFNTKVPIEVALETAEHPCCDAICVSNALPWSVAFPDRKSPLAHLGGGGVSGAPLFKHVEWWVGEARAEGLDLPLNVGGGILARRDVLALCQAGLDFARDSIFLGSVAILRPWRVADLISLAHTLKKIHTESKED